MAYAYMSRLAHTASCIHVLLAPPRSSKMRPMLQDSSRVHSALPKKALGAEHWTALPPSCLLPGLVLHSNVGCFRSGTHMQAHCSGSPEQLTAASLGPGASQVLQAQYSKLLGLQGSTLSQQGSMMTQQGSSGSLVVDALQARLRLQRVGSRQNSGRLCLPQIASAAAGGGACSPAQEQHSSSSLKGGGLWQA